MCFEFTKNKTLALSIGAIIFGLVALVHVIRLFSNFSITVNGQEVPLFASIIAALITGFMSAWLWTLRK